MGPPARELEESCVLWVGAAEGGADAEPESLAPELVCASDALLTSDAGETGGPAWAGRFVLDAVSSCGFVCKGVVAGAETAGACVSGTLARTPPDCWFTYHQPAKASSTMPAPIAAYSMVFPDFVNALAPGLSSLSISIGSALPNSGMRNSEAFPSSTATS